MHSRSRGYLPHIDASPANYFVTFRLHDSLPYELLSQWQNELRSKSTLDKLHANRLKTEYRSRIEAHLDTHFGACWLSRPEIASLVAGTLRYFNGQRYDLHAWTIMPNHVHVLFAKFAGTTLASIMHSWKGFTAHRANAILGRSGRFWQPEYFDRLIKSERQFEFVFRYILNNPMKAGLCKEAFEWPWSGCSAELEHLVKRFW